MKSDSFWSRVGKSDGCWTWPTKRKGGYGSVRIRPGKTMLAHRFAYQDVSGINLENSKVQVLHRCDNPSCVNPKHLFLGSQKDNMMDMAAKKRMPSQKSDTCKRGHLLAGDNLIKSKFEKHGWRVCRECMRAHWRKYQTKRRDKS